MRRPPSNENKSAGTGASASPRPRISQGFKTCTPSKSASVKVAELRAAVLEPASAVPLSSNWASRSAARLAMLGPLSSLISGS